MLNALGPVIGNRLAGAHRATLKPHLRERLALLARRCTPLGTIDTDADGRLSFIPKGDRLRGWTHVGSTPHTLPASAFRPGQRVRVHATAAQLLAQEVYAFEPEEVAAVLDGEGVVMEDGGCAALGLVVVAMKSEPWAFMPAFLRLVPAAEGDDECEAMTSGPAFDPYREPLALGDTVQGTDGRIGRVTLIEPQRLGVAFERGGGWCGDMGCRGSLRLLAKAAPMPATWGSTDGCPF
ncbi:hypothetical protein [Azohydromonas aeria]|uniref:hypothetical protein n=1 Tax=Azohydromonas aeria TaxID=2590212 RepID=UPI0012F7BBBE|nr:hypothetical protein [Azohydromonas aeria]